MAIGSLASTRNAFRWEMAWRSGLIGGISVLLLSVLSRPVIYGGFDIFRVMFPADAISPYFVLVARGLAAPALIIGLVAAIVAPHLRRFGLGVQVLIFGFLLGLAPTIVVMAFRLIAELISNPSLSFSGPGFLSAIGREFVWSWGLPMFLGAAFGWFLASVNLRRRNRAA